MEKQVSKKSEADRDKPTTLEKLKDIADIAQSISTVLAVLVGGWWTYRLFVKKRQDYPRATITHSVIHKPLATGHYLLHVAINVKNTGEILLRLASGFTRVQQVLPPPKEFLEAVQRRDDPVKQGDTEYPWPLIVQRNFEWEKSPRELEPAEEEEIHCDFVVDAEATTLEIYSYFKNKEKPGREIGWNLTTIYDFQAPPKPSSLPNGV